jgi:hypothetical protein
MKGASASTTTRHDTQCFDNSEPLNFCPPILVHTGKKKAKAIKNGNKWAGPFPGRFSTV